MIGLFKELTRLDLPALLLKDKASDKYYIMLQTENDELIEIEKGYYGFAIGSETRIKECKIISKTNRWED